MKQLGVLLIMVLIIFSCDSRKSNLSEPGKNDLELANLKGKVWKIQRTVHKVGDNARCPAAEKDECKRSVYVYNEKGNLIESSTIGNDGNIDIISRYEYNETDVCLEINKFSGDKLMEREVNVLQGSKVIEAKVLNEEGVIKNIYKYDYSGNDLSGGTILNKAGKILSRFQNEISNGKLDSQTVTDSIGNVLSITKYKRNKKNDVIESVAANYKDKNEYQLAFEYEYDANANWIKQTHLFEGEILKIVMRDITYYAE